MRTINVGVSHASIKQNKDDITIKQLRDNKLPLYFRYHTNNRNVGTFYLVINKQAKTHWIKLGIYPALTSKSAKEKANKMLTEAASKSVVPTQVEFTTVEELLVWYQKRVTENKALSNHTKQNQLIVIKQHLLPKLKLLALEEVSLPVIDERLFQPLQQKLTLSTLENTFAVLSAAFKRATSVQLIKYNPIPKCGLAEFTNQRPTVKYTRLDKSALLSRIKTLNKENVTHQILFILLVIHGTRIGETVSAKWQDFDFDEKLWRIPAEHTKNKKPHCLPLTEQICRWLKQYKKLTKSKWLFPQKSNNHKPISANQGSSIISNMAKKKWSAHDLRKFARSFWMESGVDYIVGELLLNHTLTKLDKTYIQTYAMTNCRAALTNWCDWLCEQGLTFDSNQNSP